MIKCGICSKPIHTDHEPGEALECLKIATTYLKKTDEIINKLMILIG